MGLKILIGVSSAPEKGGGISTYAKELALCFKEGGNDVHYVCPVSASTDWFNANGIAPFLVCEAASQVDECRRLYQYIQLQNFDCIINNDNGLLQALAPVVDTCFLSICHMESRAIAAMACANSEWCDYVVSISYDMQDAIVERFGLDRTRIPIVFNGVSYKRYRDMPDKAANWRSSAPLQCVFSGHYSRHKGADIFEKFLLSDRVPENTEYHWYGDVPEVVRQRLQRLSYVKHVGRAPREQFLEKLASADVLLFPSRQEGCPMAVLEAMALGVVPVAGNGRGAMRYLISHGQDGFVCDLRNWVAEASLILSRLEANRNLRAACGMRAQRTCESKFDIEKTAEALLFLASNPTLDRTKKKKRTKVFMWHRPGISRPKYRPSIKERIYYRIGWLRVEGELEVQA